MVERLSKNEKEMNTDPLASIEKWKAMRNHIEVYQNIKQVVIKAFESILLSMPPQIQPFVQDKIDKLNETGPLFEFEDLKSFFDLAEIHSSSLLDNLDNKEVKDYAAPYTIVASLDRIVRIHESYSEKDMPRLGSGLVGGLYSLKEIIKKTDWNKGW